MANKKEEKVEEEVVEEVVEEPSSHTEVVGRMYTDNEGRQYIWRLKPGMEAPAKVYLS
jgi:protocatechuate 3,4-dioxygenase beta subunit